MKKFATVDEVNQLVNLLKQKPEMDAKIAYYKTVIGATAKLINSIDEKLENTSNTYDSAKLELEKCEAESTLYYNQQYFENWLSIQRDYDAKYAEITKDCESNYDTLMKEAEVVKRSNLRLANMYDSYMASGNTDAKIKTEFFLYVKQEIENYKKHNKVKNIIPLHSVSESN